MKSSRTVNFHFKRIARAFIASLYFALSRDGRLARLVSGKVLSLFHRPLHPNPSNHRLDIRIPVFLEERPQRWTTVSGHRGRCWPVPSTANLAAPCTHHPQRFKVNVTRAPSRYETSRVETFSDWFPFLRFLLFLFFFLSQLPRWWKHDRNYIIYIFPICEILNLWNYKFDSCNVRGYICVYSEKCTHCKDLLNKGQRYWTSLPPLRFRVVLASRNCKLFRGFTPLHFPRYTESLEYHPRLKMNCIVDVKQASRSFPRNEICMHRVGRVVIFSPHCHQSER